jgi:hypothetical protein
MFRWSSAQQDSKAKSRIQLALDAGLALAHLLRATCDSLILPLMPAPQQSPHPNQALSVTLGSPMLVRGYRDCGRCEGYALWFTRRKNPEM